jgi:O-Antigen ligase/Tetratricopeptide repeat
VDVQRNGPILKPEGRSALRGPLRTRSRASWPDLAQGHDAGAYKGLLGGMSAVLPFGLAGIAILLWWAADEGGYAATTWYRGALLFLALLAAVVISGQRRGSPAPGARAAIALLAAFTAWNFLSIGWAGVPGDAWDGANRTLLYLTVYATFALLPWRAPEATVVLGLFAVGTALVGGVALASEGAGAFNGNRLADPIGYENASAALFLMAFWPALALAARPEVHWAARGLLLAAGGALLQLALLAQSRGSILGAAVALPLFLLLSRERMRLLAALLLVAIAALATLDPLLDVVEGGGEAEVERAVAREVVALTLSSGALLLIGSVLAFGDRPGRARPELSLSSRRAVGLLAAALMLAAVGAGVAAATLEDAPRPGLQSGRYDMWRVAAVEFAERPLLGVGADNFAVDFVRERRIDEEPLYPHSLLLRAFSQTGVVGGLLFLGFIAAALAAALARGRDPDAWTGAVAAASVTAGVYWLVHGSIDWLWEIPVLGASALAFLGLASGLVGRRARKATPSGTRRLAALAVAGVLFLAAGASYAFPGLAALELERAVRAWPDSEETFSRLERAHRLNPLSERADVVAGTLAEESRQLDRAQRAFERALERNPGDWYVQLQLALLARAEGNGAEALARLRRVRSLNPWESYAELVTDVERLALRAPLGRRALLQCGPVLGLARDCADDRRGE